MASYTTNEIRGGMKVMIDNDPCAILDNEFVKPGKGQAFNRIKFRNLKTGRVVERTWKSGDTIQAADVADVEAQYLYQDGDHWRCGDRHNSAAVQCSSVTHEHLRGLAVQGWGLVACCQHWPDTRKSWLGLIALAGSCLVLAASLVLVHL